MITLLGIFIGSLIPFTVFVYMSASDEIDQIRDDVRELRAEIKRVGKLTIPDTRIIIKGYVGIDELEAASGLYVCEVCGHRHKTPVPTCWGCGREVVSDDGGE